MFDEDKQTLETQILDILTQNQIPAPQELKWSSIPFSGEWGISTSFFQTAADEARAGKNVKVPLRAQEIAEIVKQALGTPKNFSRVGTSFSLAAAAVLAVGSMPNTGTPSLTKYCNK